MANGVLPTGMVELATFRDLDDTYPATKNRGRDAIATAVIGGTGTHRVYFVSDGYYWRAAGLVITQPPVNIVANHQVYTLAPVPDSIVGMGPIQLRHTQC